MPVFSANILGATYAAERRSAPTRRATGVPTVPGHGQDGHGTPLGPTTPERPNLPFELFNHFITID
jgi:hypothetical protein